MRVYFIVTSYLSKKGSEGKWLVCVSWAKVIALDVALPIES